MIAILVNMALNLSPKKPSKFAPNIDPEAMKIRASLFWSPLATLCVVLGCLGALLEVAKLAASCAQDWP